MPAATSARVHDDFLEISKLATPLRLPIESGLLLGVLSLPGPEIDESTAILLFGTEAVIHLLRQELAYRAVGGTLAPRPAERQMLTQLFETQPELRRSLHRLTGDRVGAAGRRIAKKERLPLLAHHYREAGAPREALEASLSFARFLRTYYRHAEAVDLLEKLLPQVGQGRERMELIEALRDAADRAGNQRTALRSAREIARRAGSVETLIRLAYHAIYAGRLTEAEQALDRAFALKPAGSSLARLLAHRSHVFFLRRKFEQAALDLERIRGLELSKSDAPLLARVHVSFGNRALGRTDYAGALRHYQEAIRLSRSARDGPFLMECLRNASIPAIYLRALPEARRYLKLSHRMADSRRDSRNRALLHSIRALLNYEEGSLLMAFNASVTAASLFGELNVPGRQAEAARNAAYYALLLDDLKGALDWSEAGIRLARQSANEEIAMRAQMIRAHVLARKGHLLNSRDLVRDGGVQTLYRTSRLARLFHLRADAELSREIGNWSRLRVVCRQGQRLALQMKDFVRTTEFSLWEAESWARMGRTEEASKIVNSLEGLVPSLNPLMVAELRLCRMECSQLLGNPILSHEASSIARILKTPRLSFRAFRLKTRKDLSFTSGTSFALEACQSLSSVEGRDRYEGLEWLADGLQRVDLRHAALGYYEEALKMVEDRLRPLPEEFAGQGDLAGTARRLHDKILSCPEGAASLVQVLANVEEMVRRGARSESVLTHVLKILCRAICARGALIARVGRARWKVMAASGLSPCDEKQFLPSMLRENWARVPLLYRGKDLGLLAYRKPIESLDIEKQSLVEILAARAAEVLHHDRMAVKGLMEQSRREIEGNRRAVLPPASSEWTDECPEFAGVSASRREIVNQCSAVAGTDINVVLVGETGTGKELLARSIHARSVRRRAPFVAVSCGSLSTRLVESELFGHERGAFSGAERSQKGLIRCAHGGTLFLDGIDELGEEGQVALLRVLEERSIRPVGGTQEVPVDFRLICSSARELEDHVREGRFRADLRHRVQGMAIRIPPLRERKEDIPVLLEKWVQGRLAFTPSAISVLGRHPWPGNVRELRNFVQAALMHAGRPVDEAVARGLLEGPKKEESSERERLLQALRNFPSITEASRQIGCSRKTFYARLKRFGIALAPRHR